MKPAVLVRIDRVLGKTKALIKAAALTENAEDAYQKFWRRMEMPFRLEPEDSDAYRHFAFEYEDFRKERDTMPAVVLDLKDIRYPGAEAIETQYTALEEKPRDWGPVYRRLFEQAHPTESERAEALARATAWLEEHEEETDWRPPGLLENLRDFQQALLKARAFCSDAQEQTEDEQGGPWSEPDSPSRWAKVFKMSARTFIRHVEKKAIRAKKLSDKSYRVALSDIPKPQASPPS